MVLRYKSQSSLIKGIETDDICSIEAEGLQRFLVIERDGKKTKTEIEGESLQYLQMFANKTLFQLVDEKVFSLDDVEGFLKWWSTDDKFGDNELREALIYYDTEILSKFSDFDEVKTTTEIVVYDEKTAQQNIQTVEAVEVKKELRKCKTCKKKTNQEVVEEKGVIIYKCEKCENFLDEDGESY